MDKSRFVWGDKQQFLLRIPVSGGLRRTLTVLID
jgi:hypothetical protein